MNCFSESPSQFERTGLADSRFGCRQSDCWSQFVDRTLPTVSLELRRHPRKRYSPQGRLAIQSRAAQNILRSSPGLP